MPSIIVMELLDNVNQRKTTRWKGLSLIAQCGQIETEKSEFELVADA